MKKRVLQIGIGFLFFFLFCTVTSLRVEQMIIPEVTVTRPVLKEETMGMTANVPTACMFVNEAGERGVWMIQSRDNIWGERTYYAEFLSDCILEVQETYMEISGPPEYAAVDMLQPLKNGQQVRVVSE